MNTSASLKDLAAAHKAGAMTRKEVLDIVDVRAKRGLAKGEYANASEKRAMKFMTLVDEGMSISDAAVAVWPAKVAKPRTTAVVKRTDLEALMATVEKLVEDNTALRAELAKAGESKPAPRGRKTTTKAEDAKLDAAVQAQVDAAVAQAQNA